MASSVPHAAPAPRAPRSHGHPFGVAIGAVAALIGLVVLAWAILFITKGRFLKHTFEKYASQSAGRPVRVAGDFQLYFAPIDLKFLAERITVKNPGTWASRENFFQADLIDTRVKTFSSLFGDKYHIEYILLRNGRVDAEWDAKNLHNTWTFGDPNAKGEPFELPIVDRASIAGTEVRYRAPLSQILADIRFQPVTSAGKQIEDAIRFAGGGSVRRTPFTLTGAILSPNETLAGGRNRFELHAGAVDTKVDVTGTTRAPTDFEGADLRVAMRGRNLADIFSLAGIATPDTRSYRIAANATKAGAEWRFTRMTGVYGQSDIAGRMTVKLAQTAADRLKLDADLTSRKVDIIDVGPFMGYNPQALATKGVTAAASTQGGATGRLLPDAPLRIDAIKAFDAHVNYKVATIRAPHVPISNVALTLDLDHTLLKLSPLTFDMSGGHVTSDISINARGRQVETAYDIRLSPTPMGKLLAGWGVEESGTTGSIAARVKMTGEGDTVRESLASSDGRMAIILPRGTFWTRNIQLAEFDIGTFVQKMFEKKLKEPVEINCGLIAFTVRDGIAAADPILIDTQKNVMLGKGGFSFKDESLDIAFRADAKNFSLFSGQSPVGINGHFASPGIQIISPQLLTRAGAGIGLAAVVAPPAALLAFVDVGDAKATACGPVLAGARAAAQRTAKGEKRDDVGNGKPKKKD